MKDPIGVWIPTGALGRVRLLNHPLWRRPCELQLTEPMRRPLSKQIFPQFLRFGTQPIYLADHIFVARRRGEDVEAFDSGGDVAGLLVRLAQLKEKARGRTGGTFRSSSSKRPDWTASGSSAFCRAKESKATLSMPRRF